MKILWLLLLATSVGFGQTGETAKPSSGDHEGISGNPYFNKDWADGIIRFSSGKTTDKFKLKFNCAQNRLLLQFNGSAFAAESRVNEFVMFTKNRKDSFLFRKGFPHSDRGNEETFYQVMEVGKATLLKLSAKDIIEERALVDAKLSRHYQDVELFYLLYDGKMHVIDKDENSLQKVLTDRGEQIKAFISEQQIRMRTQDDFVKVVRKYNQLQ